MKTWFIIAFDFAFILLIFSSAVNFKSANYEIAFYSLGVALVTFLVSWRTEQEVRYDASKVSTKD